MADITYVATGEGWLYLAAVMDLAGRRIVGWSRSETIDAHAGVPCFEAGLAVAQGAQGPSGT